MTQDAKIDQIVYSMELIRQQLEEIEGQIQSLAVILQDLTTTTDFLKNISRVEGESLIPIGRGLYIEGEVKNKERVVVNIGSNAYKKATIEDALSILDERKNDAAKAIESSRNSENDLQQRYAQLEDYLNRVYKK
ncbi:MAG: prefoldin subunit alpha [Thermoplasmatales archaeon]|jgi:prefoldin alpha subunit|nr:prefoldin subunit alpha [Candidatus Thermoplasmatota archaeon]MCL6002994.1 prefoldin subunit alpha [Candidatus Thermoplasmatota archaeon]MDA8054496.1 prefoldin subunit alpha [Thermoplasmatales archaeon]